MDCHQPHAGLLPEDVIMIILPLCNLQKGRADLVAVGGVSRTDAERNQGWDKPDHGTPPKERLIGAHYHRGSCIWLAAFQSCGRSRCAAGLPDSRPEPAREVPADVQFRAANVTCR